MLPIIQMLAANGLNLLASAVTAKGKEFVEEKLGVSLEAPKTAEDVLKLKQAEMDHEEFLLELGVRQSEMNLRETQAMYGEIDSARKMGAALATSTSWLNQNIVPILALMVTVGGAAILTQTGDADVRMAAVSMITMVLGYYFGTSIGSKDKQRVIEGLTK
jgi:hypothetical protein